MLAPLVRHKEREVNPISIMKQDVHSEAAQWFARLHAPDVTAYERDAFAGWMRNAQNAQAYASVEKVYGRTAELRSDSAIFAALRAARAQSVVRRRRRIRIAFPILAAAAVVVAIGIYWRHTPQVLEKRYETRVGERRSEILADGSTVLLDTASAISVRVGNDERYVVLERGQVQFQVVHNPKQAFVVKVGAGTIRDIGTQFQVRADDGNVVVTLLEGAVSVTTSSDDARAVAGSRTETLAPGQQLTFDRSGAIGSKRNVDLKAALGWPQGDLVFENRPLVDLVEEMNRYTKARVRVGDPTLNSIPVSGVFHQGDQQSLLLALQAGWSLRSERNGDGDIVLYRSRK